ncbi:MAG TPA: family 16 glycosylhydrolase [Candidatus Limnocylindria bacterium]|nr:family 16 glycosylhydrolase [Candidatus Limnocylindria bacterium]
MLFLLFAGRGEAALVMVQDFESLSTPPKVWVVNIPDTNAAATLSTEQSHEGRQALKLHYHFVGTGQFQYLGIPLPAALPTAIHQLRFWLKGDGSKCTYGVRVDDASGETHQFARSSGQGGVINFTGWKEVIVDLDAGHETWGGDKNGTINYPVSSITLTVGQPSEGEQHLAVESDLYFDALSVDSKKFVAPPPPHVAVLSPAYAGEVKGDTTVSLIAPGFASVTAKCWQAGEGPGSDSTVATVALDAQGGGSFVFPADHYPHGPVTVRISGECNGVKDNCYLQLYNRGGSPWQEGIPRSVPPAATGMSLVFADDFNAPLSISSTNLQATYYDHKPPGGVQDFSAHTFAGHESAKNPFTQVDTYLRIRASDRTHSAGLISSLKNDASGITARVPCYFECRFLGPNAIGTWPAFWLLTDYMTDHVQGRKVPCDELDIIEAYGGEGPHTPNAHDSYMITPHCWDQGETGKAVEQEAFAALHNPIRMGRFSVRSAWHEAFHTYGCKVTESETIYYCDDHEVGRHATLPLCRERPMFFLINLATGGGWPVDLSRYDGVADMYVDYVRVYQGRAAR